MALVVRHPTTAKPDIRLELAVRNFEADLTTEQKLTLKKYTSTPKTSDVMYLTAEIDRLAASKGIRRPFGPRLKNFLDGVQQFAALGDVLVGGSQNLIACGVWSLVRLALLTMVNVSSYLEKLSTALMEIGRSAPRYQAMALVYARSKKIQDCLAEYFIVVVEFCHEMLRFTKKSALGQLAAALRDSDVKEFQRRFGTWAVAIKEEMTICMAKRLEEEAEENSKWRALTKNFSESFAAQQRADARMKLLDSCSTYDYETTWKQLRKIGNATQVIETEQYQSWRTDLLRTRQSILIEDLKASHLEISGKLGSGKSVVLANIVGDLRLHLDEKAIIAYFFCRHDISESLKARTIIGCLFRQLLSQLPNFSLQAVLEPNELLQPSEERWLMALFKVLVSPGIRHLLDSNYKILFIVDGVYECDRSEQEKWYEQLWQIRQLRNMRIITITSARVDADGNSSLALKYIEGLRHVHVRLSIPEDNPDIEDFIDAELERCLQSERLTVGNPSLILDVQRALLQGHQGMFLWVDLQIKLLCSMKTDEGIRQALTCLPKSLGETYFRILQKSSQSDPSTSFEKSFQRPILELITVARRPLTTAELREALSVVPGESEFKPDNLVNNIFSVLATCGSVLVIDEEELTVRFIHPTVKDFLLDGFKDSLSTEFSVEAAERVMADIIITYLSYSTFESQLTLPSQNIARVPSPSKILKTTMGGSPLVSAAVRLLKSRKQPDIPLERLLDEAKKLQGSLSKSDASFYSYSTSFCWEHIPYLSWNNDQIKKILSDISPRLPTLDEGLASNALVIAARTGNAQTMLGISKICANHSHYPLDWILMSALVLATSQGLEDVVHRLLGLEPFSRLLKNCAKLDRPEDMDILLSNTQLKSLLTFSDRYDILRAAVQASQYEMVRVVLDAVVDSLNGRFVAGEIFDSGQNEVHRMAVMLDAVKVKHSGIWRLLISCAMFEREYGSALVQAAEGQSEDDLMFMLNTYHKRTASVVDEALSRLNYLRPLGFKILDKCWKRSLAYKEHNRPPVRDRPPVKDRPPSPKITNYYGLRPPL